MLMQEGEKFRLFQFFQARYSSVKNYFSKFQQQQMDEMFAILIISFKLPTLLVSYTTLNYLM